eukprot:190838_1
MKPSKNDEARFAYLLQPIRDLAKNWNIDIATELEDYLAELEDLKISFEGGSTGLDFIEAALLIQGSACVYSRKVEYLYSLLYKTLDFIAERRKEDKRAKRQRDDPDGADGAEDWEDFFKEAKHLDLGPEDDDTIDDTLFLSKPPTTLFNLRMAIGEEKNDFKITCCLTHPCGALVVEAGSMNIPDLANRYSTVPPEAMIAPIDKGFVIQSADLTDEIKPDNPNPLVMDDFPEPIELIETMHNVSDSRPEFPEIQPVHMDGGHNNMDGGHMDDSDGGVADAEDGESDSDESDDPWALNDPHADGGMVSHPFRKTRPYRIPSKVNSSFDADSDLQAEAFRHLMLTDVLGGVLARAYRTSALKTTRLIDFSALFWHEFRNRRLARRNRQRQRERAAYSGDASGGQVLDMGVAEASDSDGGGFSIEDLSHADRNDTWEMDKTDQDEKEFDEIESLERTYEDLCREHIESYMRGAASYERHTTLARRVQAWEKRLMPILEEENGHPEFDIEKYGNHLLESLSRHSTLDNAVVSEWGGQVGQDAMSDVSSVCSADDHHDDIDSQSSQSESIAFQSVMRKSAKYDVCRYFLAALELTNRGNISIQDRGLNRMSMTLIDTKSRQSLNSDADSVCSWNK